MNNKRGHIRVKQDLDKGVSSIPRIGWTSREIASALGCTDRTVKTLIARGDLPSVKLGGLRVVLDEDLRKALAARVQHGWLPKSGGESAA